MNELIQRFLDLLQTHVITLGEEPVEVIQVVWLVGTLAVALVIAGFLRRWFRHLFDRLGMPQSLRNRLLAMIFLVILVFGGGLAFRFADISTGFFGKLFDYPLTDLFQPPREPGETDTTADVAKLTLARLFYGFVICLRNVYSLKIPPMGAAATGATGFSNCRAYPVYFTPLSPL